LLEDIAKVRNGERSVVVIDSQGDLIHNLLKLEAVGDILGYGQKQVPVFMCFRERHGNSTWAENHQKRFSCCL
jgi:hypothetical protein